MGARLCARLSQRLSQRLLERLTSAGRGDAGHEAVGQALLISIGVGAMLAAGRLAEVAGSGMNVVLAALH